LSIGAWWAIQNNLDFKYLVDKTNLKSKIHFFFISIISDHSIKGSESWEKVHDSYLKLIGLQEEYTEYLKCKVEYKDLMCDRIITGDRFINNFLRIKEAELESIKNKFNTNENIDNSETIILLEEQRGLPIDEWTMSVKKYYDLVKYYTEKKKKEINSMAA
jgi:hypothetical protein